MTRLQNCSPRASGRRGDRQAVKTTAFYGQVTYTYKKGPFIYTIDGRICELSHSGCTIRGTLAPMVGERVRVLLSLKGEPICIQGAIVSGVVRDCFGVKFPALKPKLADQLRELQKDIRSKRENDLNPGGTYEL